MPLNHAPLPWRLSDSDPSVVLSDDPDNAEYPFAVAFAEPFVPGNEGNDDHGAANAALIVRACNSHDGLVTQLKGLLGLARFIIDAADIDADLTTCVLRNNGEAVAEVPIALLQTNAQAALAEAEALS